MNRCNVKRRLGAVLELFMGNSWGFCPDLPTLYLPISNWNPPLNPPLPAEVHRFTAALGLGILISQAARS
jgi:hypothetical protein